MPSLQDDKGADFGIAENVWFISDIRFIVNGNNGSKALVVLLLENAGVRTKSAIVLFPSF